MRSAPSPFAAMAGTTAVVTGAARGIGFQIATTLQEVGLAGVEAELAGLPPLRVWINNAGVVSHQAAEDVDLTEFDRVLRNNAATALRGCQVAHRHMRAETGADRAIVNLSS